MQSCTHAFVFKLVVEILPFRVLMTLEIESSTSGACKQKLSPYHREVNEYASMPSTNWGTTYNTQFDGWKVDRELRGRQLRATTAPAAMAGRTKLIESIRGGSSTQSTLQDAELRSSYHRAYGRLGHNPRNHYVPADGRAVFSRRATTADLL